MKTYTTMRDRAFIRCCRREIGRNASGSHLPAREVARRAAASSPGAYFVEYDYALRTVRRHRRHPSQSPFWRELSDKVAALERRHGLTEAEALSRELSEGSPSSFFLTDAYALRLYHRICATDIKKPIKNHLQ